MQPAWLDRMCLFFSRKITWTQEITALLQCFYFVIFFVPLWFFWRGQKDKSQSAVEWGVCPAKGAPCISWKQGEGDATHPSNKTDCKEQSKTTPWVSQNFVQSGIRLSGSWNVSAVIPSFDSFLPSLFPPSLIPAVLGIKKEINTPLKSPNTNKQVCYF